MRKAIAFLALLALINCSCDSNCANCETNKINNDTTVTEICRQCKKGYKLNEKNACIKEEPTLPGCETLDSSDKNKCLLCLYGYELQDDGTCQQIYDFLVCENNTYYYCLSCNKRDTSQCGECYRGYELVDGECFVKPSGSMSLGTSLIFIILMNIIILF